MQSRTKTAVALLSSGLDSSIALAMAIDSGWRVPLALTFDYGQRAAQRETAAAARIASHFGARHRTIAAPWFKELSHAGNLVSGTERLPEPRVADLCDTAFTSKSAKAVWVPNRNGVLIEIAAAFAEDLDATAVLVGFNREEAATFPDNSVTYMEAISRALAYSTSNGVAVLSPTAPLAKPQIVAEGRRLGFPFSLLWSCYEAGERMCGRCESCTRLKRALVDNSLPPGDYFEDAVLR